jgi:hypothetical protein
MDTRSKDLIIENIPLLNKLSERYRDYQVATIDLERIICFLTQFETSDKIRIIIDLLHHIELIDSNKMTFLLRKAYNKISPELLKKSLIAPLGTIQDSSSVICYNILKTLFDSEENTLNRVSDISAIGKNIMGNKPSSIIFFDDNITSGTQLYNFFEELIEGKDNSEIVKTHLTKEEYETLKTVPICICYAIQLDEGSNQIVEEIRSKYNLDLKIHYGKVDYNNYLDYSSHNMKSEEEAKFSRDFIREIATAIYDDKGWPSKTIYQRLLGYGNLGKLTVFYYNIPKSFIPVFWKYGTYKGRPWIPLFPETQEQKKIESDNTDFDFILKDAVQGWINSTPNNRKPSILLGFEIDNGVTQEILVKIPSKAFLNKYFEKIYSLKLEYQPNQSRRRIKDIGENIYPTSFLSIQKYKEYKDAVDIYNQEFDNYCHKIEEYIYRQSSNTNITFILSNYGDMSANHCIVKLLYNTGELLFDQFDELEKPKFDLTIPQIEEYSQYASGTLTPIFPKLDFFGSIDIKVKDPFKKDTNYQCKPFNDLRIGQKDDKSIILQLTRMQLDKFEFDISYEINFEEQANTTKEILKIVYEEVEEISEKLEKEINRSIDNLCELPNR